MRITRLLLTVGCLAQLTFLYAQNPDTREADSTLRAGDGKSRFDGALEYTAEWQTDFRSGVKWVNLLQASLDVKLYKGLHLEAKTISTASTREDGLIDDWQGCSNIEAENIPLTFSVLCLTWETPQTTLSIGVRNFNENYFTTDVTGFFTHGSHGIFPTVSANFPIANYPVASLGLDFEWRIRDWTLNASLYNGTGFNSLFKRDNIFCFRPKKDGVFGALSLNHEAGYGNSHLGTAIHYDGTRVRAAVWTYSEFLLGERCSLMLQYSCSPFKETECTHYAGLGFTARFRRVETGIAANYVRFHEATDFSKGQNEWAGELSVKIPVLEKLELQPSLHFVGTAGTFHCLGLFRLVLAI